jgi:hypothetical protein
MAPLGAALLSAGRLDPLSLSPQALLPGFLAPALSVLQVMPTAISVAPAVLPTAPELMPAPAVQPAPASSFTERLGKVETRLAAPLAAAMDQKSGSDSSVQAGRKIEEVVTGQGSVAQAEDLPPAGPAADLTTAQEAWLRASLVQGPAPILTEAGFMALVRNDPAALGQILPWLRQTPNALTTMLSSIYQSLYRTVDAEGLDGGERAALAQALNDRFSSALAALGRSDALSKSQREVLSAVHDRFLGGYVALDEITHHRQASSLLGKVQKDALSLVAASDQQSFAEDRWILQPPLPGGQRGQGVDREERILLRTGELERNIKDWEFYMGKYLSRYRIVMREPRFSQVLRDQMTQVLSNFLGRFFQTQGGLHSNLERIPGFSLHSSFVNPLAITAKAHSIVWVPDNANLRLIPEPGGYRVEAAFETDIQDDSVLKTVKDSIEEYWDGRFDWNGSPTGLRARIDIKKLAPGQAFSAGSLRILDSRSGVSHATRDTIVLDRNLRYDVPAHEFGHILGLADEYREGYDPDLAAAVMLQNHASIMGSPKGKVLPRHLKTVYQLLRRHSLRP